MLRQIESDREERREVQKEQLLQALEERFLRHVAESEKRVNAEIIVVDSDPAARNGGTHTVAAPLEAAAGLDGAVQRSRFCSIVRRQAR